MAKRTIDPHLLPSNNLENIEPVEEKQIVASEMRGGAKTRGRGGFASMVRTIGNTLFEEIVIPAIQSLTEDFVGEAVRMLVRGGKRSSRGPTRGRGRGHIDYNRQYARRGVKKIERRTEPKRSPDLFEDIFYDYREDAELILGNMMAVVAEYGWATIGDLYSFAEISSNITHERWGWTDLQRTRVQHTTDGYIITFPDPEYLK